MRSHRISTSDFYAALRQQNILSLSQIECVIIESNGSFSVYKKEEVEAEQKVIEKEKNAVRQKIKSLQASLDTDRLGNLLEIAKLQEQLESLNQARQALRVKEQSIWDLPTRQDLQAVPGRAANPSRLSPSPSRSPRSKSPTKFPSRAAKPPTYSSATSSKTRSPEQTLEYRPLPGGTIWCDGCNTVDSNLFYNCGTCGLDFCPECEGMIDDCRAAGHRLAIISKAVQEPTVGSGDDPKSERSRRR